MNDQIKSKVKFKNQLYKACSIHKDGRNLESSVAEL